MTYKEVFTYNHLYQSAIKCYKGVGWKQETQSFRLHEGTKILTLQNTLYNHSFKSRGFKEFDINERGKLRHIKGVYFDERVVQRCLCNYYLTPLLSKSLIYDNGASVKNKGLTFTVNRLIAHLEKYYRQYGNEGYVLRIDVHDYFNSIDHDILKDKLSKKIKDDEIKDLVFYFIDNCGEGLNLGSQVSQMCALYYTSNIDHYIKEKLHAKYYGRYMDDSYIISNDKKYLQKCLKEIESLYNELGLALNPKKTQIIKLSKGINFLHRRFLLTNTGKVLKYIDRVGITRLIHKIKKLSMEHRREVFISWWGSFYNYNIYWRVRNISIKYNLEKEFKLILDN